MQKSTIQKYKSHDEIELVLNTAAVFGSHFSGSAPGNGIELYFNTH